MTKVYHDLRGDPDVSHYRLLTGLVVPRPIGWIGTRRSDGTYNLAPFSFFNVVSTDPPVVLFSAGRHSDRPKDSATLAEETGEFTVNILAESQAALSDHFAGRAAGALPNFRFVDWLDGTRLDCAPAALNCCLFALHEGGDHWIAVGRVRAIHNEYPSTEPLIFHRGRYL